MAFIKLNFKDISKKNKKSWIKRMTGGIEEMKQDKPGHCGNYSSKVCLSCGRCWKNSAE